MRFLAILTILTAIGAFWLVRTGEVVHAGQQPTPAASPTVTPTTAAAIIKKIEKLDVRLHPDYVALLKKQAEERKAFLDTQAEARGQLKAAQARERGELIETHRAARRQFSDEKHTRDDRSAFFKKLRAQMDALETRHKAQLADLAADQDKALERFHAEQKQARGTLARSLSLSRK